MTNLSFKQKIMVIVAIVGATLILIFQRGLYGQAPQSPDPSSQQIQSEDPKVVLTNPDPLEEAIILPTQTIEVTFNLPLENAGEFKNKIDPEADLQVQLSDDRKTVKITPGKPLKLGAGFTLTVLPGTKFDGKKVLDHDIVFHFKTVGYKGV